MGWLVIVYIYSEYTQIMQMFYWLLENCRHNWNTEHIISKDADISFEAYYDIHLNGYCAEHWESLIRMQELKEITGKYYKPHNDITLKRFVKFNIHNNNDAIMFKLIWG